MSISAEQRAQDPHAGHGDSYPLDPEHIDATWDLAGQAANPDEIRKRVIAYAHAHGLTSKLPDTAKKWLLDKTKLKKAKNDDLSALFSEAWNHESMEGDTPEKRRLVQFASERGLTHLLPDEAHSLMHELGVRDKHADLPNAIEDAPEAAGGAGHTHRVVKAFNPLAKQGQVVKAWTEEGDDQSVYFEGWMSPPHRDLERDITEPEAFVDSLDSYSARSAPVSIEHNDKALPIGHLQKAAILRDGKVLKPAEHPSDAADFTRLPEMGSGVWVRGVANEGPGQSAIRKGNVSGMSFIGNFTEWENLPGGGKRYLKIEPLIESTIAAYPVNPKAAFRIAKAFGLSAPTDQGTQDTMEDLDLETILVKAAEKVAAERAAAAAADASKVQKAVTADDLGALLVAFEERLSAKLDAAIDSKITKAMPATRGEGVGRKGTVPAAGERTIESDPAGYIVRKARGGHETFTHADKNPTADLTLHVLKEGMIDDDDATRDFEDD